MTGVAFKNIGVSADLIWKFAVDGRIFVSSDADENDTVTGQTSFAVTTPTFLLDVPADTTAVPLFVNLTQTGTVAGGLIGVRVAIDNVKRYASGGTSEKVYNPNKHSGKVARSALYSGATGISGSYGIMVFAADFGADVDTAEGAVQGPYWSAEVPYILHGPASFLVFTYAGTTGPTWGWSIGWAEIPTKEFPTYGSL